LKNDDMTNAEKLFKTFYGDDFDESALSTDNGGIVYQAGINTSAYLGMDIALYSADYEFQENSSGQTYVVGLDEGYHLSFLCFVKYVKWRICVDKIKFAVRPNRACHLQKRPITHIILVV